jgi:phosphoribosylanthranilate isomerase
VSVQIKLCGVRRASDALLCAEAGADEIGVVFAASSKRRVTLDDARAIRAALPPTVPLTAVFLDASLDELSVAASTGLFSRLQLHGAVPHGAGLLDLPLVRALQLKSAESLEDLALLPPGGGPAYARVLLDGPAGGSGLSFAWELAKEVRARLTKVSKGAALELFVAGGLHAGNVAQAIAAAGPDGVDVASGIEGPDAFKDPERVRAFIAAVRAAPRAP